MTNRLQDVIRQASVRSARPIRAAAPSKGMVAALTLESIADNFWVLSKQGKAALLRERSSPAHLLRMLDRSGPWVARITGHSLEYGLAREFLRPRRDYKDANSVGSRGVRLCYLLPEGVYEVHAWETWQRDRRYFVRSQAGRITEISLEEVETWLTP